MNNRGKGRPPVYVTKATHFKEAIEYFGRTYHKADLAVDIAGLDVEASAAKLERLVRERAPGRPTPADAGAA